MNCEEKNDRIRLTPIAKHIEAFDNKIGLAASPSSETQSRYKTVRTFFTCRDLPFIPLPFRRDHTMIEQRWAPVRTQTAPRLEGEFSGGRSLIWFLFDISCSEAVINLFVLPMNLGISSKAMAERAKGRSRIHERLNNPELRCKSGWVYLGEIMTSIVCKTNKAA